MIMVAVVSVATHVSITVTLPDRYDSYVDCLYWASVYRASVNDQAGTVRVQEVQCRTE